MVGSVCLRLVPYTQIYYKIRVLSNQFTESIKKRKLSQVGEELVVG
jgi:hypothetical protein